MKPTVSRTTQDLLLFERLSAPRRGRTLCQALFNVALLVTLSWIGLRIDENITWIAVWLSQGVILTGFLSAAHECVHEHFWPDRRINAVFGRLWATPALLNFSLYRFFHLRHHQYTGVAGDPEGINYALPTIGKYATELCTSGMKFTVFMITASADVVCGREPPEFVRGARARHQVWIDSWILLGFLFIVVLLTMWRPTLMVKLAWAPWFAYFLALFWTGLPEHFELGPGETRSIRSNWLFRTVYWSANFHAEHHAEPRVPAHNLYRLHELLQTQLPHRETSYILYHWKLIRRLLVDSKPKVPRTEV